MTDMDYDGSTPLNHPRHERFTQNLAQVMSADKAYTEAGYQPSRAHASRLAANGNIQTRLAWLQGSTADQIMEVRDIARQHTKAAIETLVSVMESSEAPAAARVAAAQGLLDRGWGKPTQYVQEGENPYDALSLTERQALLAALDALDDEASDEDENATRH